MGEAFQLRDDLLGVFGDPARTGKPSGEDLREGKRTLLLTLAEQYAEGSSRALLRDLVGDDRLDDEGLASLRRVLIETGAVAEVERRIHGLVSLAHGHLDSMSLPGDVRRRLHAVATACAWRVA